MQDAASSDSSVGNSATVKVINAVATGGKVCVKIENMLFNTFNFSANDDKEMGQQLRLTSLTNYFLLNIVFGHHAETK
jgi:hypothetical protein